MSSEDALAKIKKRLKAVVDKPENQFCCDCNDKRPTWASIMVPPPGVPPEHAEPIGAFCCFHCSGAHRRLGVHICFVRSITLDEWKEKEVIAMEMGGNNRINDAFEAKLTSKEAAKIKPDSHSDLEVRNSFIRAKYNERKFLDPKLYAVGAANVNCSSPKSSNHDFFQGMSTENLFSPSKTALFAGMSQENLFSKSKDDLVQACLGSNDDDVNDGGMAFGKKKSSTPMKGKRPGMGLSRIDTLDSDHNDTGFRQTTHDDDPFGVDDKLGCQDETFETLNDDDHNRPKASSRKDTLSSSSHRRRGKHSRSPVPPDRRSPSGRSNSRTPEGKPRSTSRLTGSSTPQNVETGAQSRPRRNNTDGVLISQSEHVQSSSVLRTSVPGRSTHSKSPVSGRSVSRSGARRGLRRAGSEACLNRSEPVDSTNIGTPSSKDVKPQSLRTLSRGSRDELSAQSAHTPAMRSFRRQGSSEIRRGPPPVDRMRESIRPAVTRGLRRSMSSSALEGPCAAAAAAALVMNKPTGRRRRSNSPMSERDQNGTTEPPRPRSSRRRNKSSGGAGATTNNAFSSDEEDYEYTDLSKSDHGTQSRRRRGDPPRSSRRRETASDDDGNNTDLSRSDQGQRSRRRSDNARSRSSAASSSEDEESFADLSKSDQGQRSRRRSDNARTRSTAASSSEDEESFADLSKSDQGTRASRRRGSPRARRTTSMSDDEGNCADLSKSDQGVRSGRRRDGLRSSRAASSSEDEEDFAGLSQSTQGTRSRRRNSNEKQDSAESSTTRPRITRGVRPPRSPMRDSSHHRSQSARRRNTTRPITATGTIPPPPVPTASTTEVQVQ